MRNRSDRFVFKISGTSNFRELNGRYKTNFNWTLLFFWHILKRPDKNFKIILLVKRPDTFQFFRGNTNVFFIYFFLRSKS
jgi:hypothetical protein